MSKLDRKAYKELIEHLKEYKDGIGHDEVLPNPKYLSRWMDDYGAELIAKLEKDLRSTGATVAVSAEEAWQAHKETIAHTLANLDALGRQDLEESFKAGFSARVP